jgi:hypothetical protein
MNVNDLTLGQLRELQYSVSGPVFEPFLNVGKAYFIRSVTHHYTGKCVKCTKEWVELEDAAWIADDGRFNEFLKTGNANEVEPYVNSVRIPIGCILDATEWQHALPRSVK